MRRIAAIFICSIAMLSMTGCKNDRQLRSDMATQPRYATEQPADLGVFTDGVSARRLPAGVLARDPKDVPGIPYSAVWSNVPAMAHELLPEDAAMPFPVTADVLERGRTHFESTCAVCHGRLGNGQGMIVQRGFTPPPSFHVPRLRAVSDAHIYNVISNGFGAMFPYADRLRPNERWEVIAYVRALEAAPDVAGLPPDSPIRKTLIAGGDRPTQPTTAPSTQPAPQAEGGAR